MSKIITPTLALGILVSTSLAHASPIYVGMEGQGSYNVPAHCSSDRDLDKYAIGDLPSIIPERGTRFEVLSSQDGFTVKLKTLLYKCNKIVSDNGAPEEFWWDTVAPPAGKGLSLIPHKHFSFGKKYEAELSSREVIIPAPDQSHEEAAVQTEGEISLPFSAALTSSEISSVLRGKIKHKHFDVRVAVPESRTLNFRFYIDVRFERAEDEQIKAVLQ